MSLYYYIGAQIIINDSIKKSHQKSLTKNASPNFTITHMVKKYFTILVLFNQCDTTQSNWAKYGSTVIHDNPITKSSTRQSSMSTRTNHHTKRKICHSTKKSNQYVFIYIKY